MRIMDSESFSCSDLEDDDEDDIDFSHFYGPKGFIVPCDDPEWASLREEEEEVKPKITIEERIRLREEKEARLLREAYSRGYPSLPDDYVPVIEKKPSIEEKRAKHKAWEEKMERVQQEKEALMLEHTRKARLEYEKYAKIQKDNQTRDYYWKPDPLFVLHLRDLGYSKIAADKALFYVDNKSVALALEYLRQNPNPTELTKEEVMAAGEEVLKRIRPVRPPKPFFMTENKTGDDDMEVDSTSQPVLTPDLEDLTTKEAEVVHDGGIDQAASTAVVGQATSTAVVGQTASTEVIGPAAPARVTEINILKERKKAMDRMKAGHTSGARGQKRNYDGEAIKRLPATVILPSDLPVVNEIVPNRRMIFIVNTRLLMDAVTLSLEVGKAAIHIMDAMARGSDGLKKDQEEWIKDGSAMAMFKGNDSNHLNRLHKSCQEIGYINYLAQCSHYRHVRTPSPTVLGIFADKKQLRRITFDLQRM